MTDRLTPLVTDRLLIMYGILMQHLSLLQQLCTVDNGIFYVADVNIVLLLTQLINTLPDKYFIKKILSG